MKKGVFALKRWKQLLRVNLPRRRYSVKQGVSIRIMEQVMKGKPNLLALKGCLIVQILLMISVVFGADQNSPAEEKGGGVPIRNRIYSFRHITAQRAKDALAQLEIGQSVSQIPDYNAIIVTAYPTELVKATSVLKLIDSEEQFVIKRIASVPVPNDWPSNNKIALQLGEGAAIGTLMDPPGKSRNSAIIDVHKGAVIVIAAAERFEAITSAIGKLREEARKTAAVKQEEVKQAPTEKLKGVSKTEPNEVEPVRAEPNRLRPVRAEPNKAEPNLGKVAHKGDEFFDKLLESLQEAEKTAVKESAKAEQIPRYIGVEPNRLAQGAQEAAAAPSPNQPAPAVEQEELKAPSPAAVAGPEPNKTLPQIVPAPEAEAAEVEPNEKAAEEMTIPRGEETLELSLPETVDIIALVDLVGKYLNLDYLYDPSQITGTVTLKLQGPIKVKDLYALLESVMKFRGFAMSRKGNLVTIVPLGNVLDFDPSLRTEGRAIQPGDVVVTRVFTLSYISTANARNLLINMRLGANVTDLPETGQLIVTEYAYRMDRIEQLLELVDQPGPPRQFRFRQLKYTLATSLAPKIKSLTDQLGNLSITIAAQQQQPPSPAERRYQRRVVTPTPGQPQPGGGETRKGVYLDYDERTNRIFMIGLIDELTVVEQLIDAFDVPQQDLRTIKEYEIQYVDASEVVSKLETLGIVGGVQAAGGRPGVGPQPPGQPGAPALTGIVAEQPQIAVLDLTNSLLVNATAEQHAAIALIIAYVDREPAEASLPYVIYPLENQDPNVLVEVLNELVEKTIKDKEGKVQARVKKEEEITIVADPSTFSLIVYASKKNQEWIGKLIRTLDTRRPQVLIDVTLVEIRRTDDFEYDLEIVSSIPDLDHTSGLLNAIGGTTTDIILGKLNSATDRKRFIEGRFDSTGGGKGFYGDKHIQALLKLIQEKNYGRVLAKPKILVNDAESGKITTTDTRYIAETTIVDTQVGGTRETTAFKPYTAKIELEIKPHISEGDLLRLETVLTREDFLETTSGGQNAPPDQAASSVTTVITVPDGKTIILGGLIKLNQSKGGTKVPILGDVPVVGTLFRSVTNKDFESKLYIFVKANILRPVVKGRGLPQLEQISQENRNAFESNEKQFQEYEGIPGIKAGPMPPPKVLEEK